MAERRGWGVDLDVGVASAAGRGVIIARLERPQALERDGGIDEGAVHGEVLAVKQLVRLGLGADGGEEGLGCRCGRVF